MSRFVKFTTMSGRPMLLRVDAVEHVLVATATGEGTGSVLFFADDDCVQVAESFDEVHAILNGETGGAS